MNDNIQSKVLETFTHIHNNGEVSWNEVKTTNYIKKILEENNCKVTTFDNATGVVGTYGNFKTNLPVVAIRADIDALWQKVNGKYQANHSCGHDAHTAMVLGVLWKLNQITSIQNQVAVKFIFQPAEEVGEGALKMVENKIIDNVDYLFGIHLRPEEETKDGYATPVIVHGATKTIRFNIIGEDAHGARPHLNKNAIELGAELITLINNIHLDPRVPHSAKITRFNSGGENANIIPGEASFSMDLRAQNNETMDLLVDKVHHILKQITSMHNVKLEITKTSGIPAAEVNHEAINKTSKAISRVLGEDKVTKHLVTPGGDDFHYYTIKKPDLKATMIGLGCNLKPGLHHPNMTFNHESLMNGVNILFESILEVYSLDDTSKYNAT